MQDLRRLCRFSVLYQGLCGASGNLQGEGAWRVRAMTSFERRSPTLGRRLLHEVIIAGLAGAWEQLVESLILDSVNYIQSRCKDYSSLPEPFAKQHYELSLKMLDQLARHRKFAHIDRVELLRRLHVCLSGASPYQLNDEVFLIRTANIRHDELSTLYSRIGIPTVLDRLRDYRPFRKLIESIHGKPSKSLPPRVVYEQLDQLIELRNDVAHGCVDNILSASQLKSLIVYVERLGLALADTTRLLLLETSLARTRSAGHTLQVFGNSIVCVNKGPCRLRVGDWLLGADADGRLVGGSPIVAMQVDNRNLALVRKKAGVKVGMQVGFHAKVNYKYFIVSSDALP